MARIQTYPNGIATSSTKLLGSADPSDATQNYSVSDILSLAPSESVSSVFGRVGNILALSSDYNTFYPTLTNLPGLVSNNTAVAANTLKVGFPLTILTQTDGTQNAKFINVLGRMTISGNGGDENGGTLNLTSNTARLGIATSSIAGGQPEASLDVGKNARVRGSLNVGLTNEQYLFVSTTGDTPVGYVKMGYYGTGTDYNLSGGAQSSTQYTTAFNNGGKICEDERIMTFKLSRTVMVASVGGGTGAELIPSDTNFTYIVKEAYIYSVPTGGGSAPTMAANENLVINYQTDNNGVRTTTAWKLGAAELNASATSRKLMTFEQSNAVVIGTVNAVPRSSVRLSTTNGFSAAGVGTCDFYLRMRVKNIDFSDDISNNDQLITIT